jgi:hypothetical protein
MRRERERWVMISVSHKMCNMAGFKHVLGHVDVPKHLACGGGISPCPGVNIIFDNPPSSVI